MPNKASADQHVSKDTAIKILHVIPSIAPCRGGPSKAVIEMVAALRASGVNAEIATTNDNGPSLLDVELNTKINYKNVPVRFFKRYSPPINAVREFAYSSDFKRWLRQNISRYDVVHVHAVFSFCCSYTMALARKTNTPYVVRPIGQLQKWSLKQAALKKNFYLKIIERKNIESASAIQFTANSEKLEAEQLFTVNGHVIPLGITLPPSSSWSKQQLLDRLNAKDSKLNVLYLSRLHEKKGLEILMQAFAEIDADSKLWIAGDGQNAYRQHLNEYAEQLGISERCCFIGHVDGDYKHELLHHADLFALTSYSENFGIAVLEAMSAGLTPLVTRGVALSDVIEAEKLGLVCEPTSISIMNSLRFAYTHESETRQYGAQAKLYTTQEFGWSNVANQLVSLYESIHKKGTQ